ncbi:TnsA endonuclease N-terminal domain-containing protein [Neiella marina]|uniref:TnsA endonuclease N-terminal domain-containing protein n=1 Tax=Neiella holothuriorum TaxID=2870530 RepID=A0ABS7EHK8_9GAMM|nr:TnsA endonuclease N-terminal domain-containing protein [Neiella holothuriorum]MBW8191822.1 TnsA endonuclease N-terminal domain-containing protein [Neiella holothuriorum]
MNKQPEITAQTVKHLNQWKREIAPPNPYKSFFSIRQTNKIGRRHRKFCPRQKRLVELMSDGEHHSYLALIWHPNTREVMDQYALDIDETMSIAGMLDITHPQKWETNEAIVMTTDFVVRRTCSSNGIKTIAYSFKYWNKIYKEDQNGSAIPKNLRTWQKFAIEREYWHRREIEYRLITERDATKVMAWNLAYFASEYEAEVSENELKDFCHSFIRVWSDNPLLELQDIISAAATELKTTFQRAQTLLKKAGLHRLIPFDINSAEIRLFRPVRLLP